MSSQNDYSWDGLSGGNPLAGLADLVKQTTSLSVDWLSSLSVFDSPGHAPGEGKNYASPAYDDPKAYDGPMSLNWDGSGATKDDRSFFQRMGDGLVSAAEKDPLRVAQAGLGALYGAYKDSKQADRDKQMYDLYASRIAAEKEQRDQYNASFGGAGKARPAVQRNATRVNGQRIYNDNGTMNRG